ncbi:hypothetical protein [Chromobacterium alticapitis]|nr:hypothetical protein [Chromobacterium alticapitis]
MMLIVLLAWLYVVLMFAVGQDSVGGGLAVAFLLGVLPTWFVAWTARNRLRRSREARKTGREA